MQREQADKFFASVAWFNSFFRDVKTLLDRITNQIEGYDSKLYYYYKPNDVPAIPRVYHALLGSEGKPAVSISVIFDKDIAQSTFLTVDEPTILVVIHTHKWDHTAVTQALLEGKGVKETMKMSDVVRGTVWDKPEVRFHAFTVPLDAFAEYSDEIARNRVVSKIDQILEEYKQPVTQ